MRQPARIALVTLGLIAAGALLGALAGVAAISLGFVSTTGITRSDADILLFVAEIGAVLGAALGPAVAWLLLRHVPLGRALAGTTLGAVLGGAATWIAQAPFFPLWGALGGFLLAAVLLRVYAGGWRQGSRPAPLVLPPNGALQLTAPVTHPGATPADVAERSARPARPPA